MNRGRPSGAKRATVNRAELREAYFARVQPVLGEGLSRIAVSVDGAALPLLARSLELLAGCRLGRILVRGPASAPSWPMPRLFAIDERESALEALARYLRFKNPYAPPRFARSGRGELHLEAELVAEGAQPAIRWQGGARTATLLVPDGDLLAHQDLSYALARDARDALLGRRPFPDGPRYLGDSLWPFAESPAPPCSPPPRSPDRLDGAHLLVLGCGSVGSEALRLLAGSGARFSLLDGGRVSIFNPHRQWFGASEIGTPKVESLARRLGPRTRQLPFALEEKTLPALEALLAEDPPDAVLLATGTAAGALAAPLLWRRGIPHLAACAYPRARFFELAILLPRERTPCLHCLRGHLDRGPEAELPIDDELGRFLYQEIPLEERERRWQELCAEPATPIETGRIADLAARCVLELPRTHAERSPWFRRLAAEGTSCLIGGNQIERNGDGALAYGIRYPGQVVRLGLGDLYATDARSRCEVCGRVFRPSHREPSAEASPEELDQVLLG